MRSNRGIIIESVKKGSIAEKLGLQKNDKIICVNGNSLDDIIDLIYHANEQSLTLIIERDKEEKTIEVHDNVCGIGSLGLTLKPFKIKTCKNNCIFCFISQLPKGLRKSLYIKDEDYRMSFLYGNFITLTNLSAKDKIRIIQQRLSPLYISVHCSDTEIRNKMLGNPHAEDILREISFFAENRIQMHTQIVLCPGYNDNKYLSMTIANLYKLHPYVMSIAVVPVGLTRHRKKELTPVNKEDAINAIEIIEKFQARFRRKHGESIVFASDEMYLKAEKPLPSYKIYDDFPQIENGVGMVSKFIHLAKKINLKDTINNNSIRFLTFTGISFYPFLLDFIKKIRKLNIDIHVIPIENSFFGNSVTVAGLLTGRDIIKAFTNIVKRDDILLVPDVTLREGEKIFLDNVFIGDIEEILGVKVFVIESTPQGLIKAIYDIAEKFKK